MQSSGSGNHRDVWPMRPLSSGDPGGWPARAREIRRAVEETLGRGPDTPPGAPDFDVGPCTSDGEVRRTRVSVRIAEDDVMEAWLLEPVNDALPHHGVALALHQTIDFGKDEPAGLAGSSELAYARELVLRGWTAFAPDQFAVPRRFAKGLKAYDTTRFYERYPEWSAVGKSVADARLALDVLERLPETRGQSVCAIGHSLGGHTALFLGALDPRPAQIVCNCGLFPFADSINRTQFFRDEWYIYLKDAALKRSVMEGPQPLWDFHELAALIAPRRLWIGGATNDSQVQAGFGLHETSRQLHELYRCLNADGALAVILHNEKHSFPRWCRQAAYAWLEARTGKLAAEELQTYC